MDMAELYGKSKSFRLKATSPNTNVEGTIPGRDNLRVLVVAASAFSFDGGDLIRPLTFRRTNGSGEVLWEGYVASGSQRDIMALASPVCIGGVGEDVHVKGEVSEGVGETGINLMVCHIEGDEPDFTVTGTESS